MRAFVALEIPAAARQRIGGLIETLRPQLPGVRWLAPEAIHLTLRFLGESTDAQIERLKPPLASAAAACPRREVPVSGLGMFPERGSPRVLWLGMPLPPPMVELQHACESAARAAGFAKEDKPFRSHVTLGRWRDPVRRPALPEADAGTAALELLILYKSDLHPKGAVHTPLASFPLRSLL
jgi:2'-5' RNA ligase